MLLTFSLLLEHNGRMLRSARRFISIGRIQPIKQAPSNLPYKNDAPSNGRLSKLKAVVKEGSNWLLILCGIAGFGAVFYALGEELFFNSRNEAYEQLFEEASYLIKASAEVRQQFGGFGAPIHCSYGKRNTTRNRLITGEEWMGKRKYSFVQFYVSSVRKEGLVTVRASRTKNNTLEIESIDIEDLSRPNQKPISLDLGRKKRISRFGFGLK